MTNEYIFPLHTILQLICVLNVLIVVLISIHCYSYNIALKVRKYNLDKQKLFHEIHGFIRVNVNAIREAILHLTKSRRVLMLFIFP